MRFTSARQIDNFLEVAGQLDLPQKVVGACRRALIASIGPICSEALRSNRIAVAPHSTRGGRSWS